MEKKKKRNYIEVQMSGKKLNQFANISNYMKFK